MAEAASWTGSANDVAGTMAPVTGAIEVTVGSDVPDGVMPPSTVRPVPLVTTASRERGAARGQASMPASIDGGPDVWPWVAVLEGLADVDAALFGAGAVDVVVRVEAVGEEPPWVTTTTTPMTTIRTRAPMVATRRRCRWMRRVRRACWARRASS